MLAAFNLNWLICLILMLMAGATTGLWGCLALISGTAGREINGKAIRKSEYPWGFWVRVITAFALSFFFLFGFIYVLIGLIRLTSH